MATDHAVMATPPGLGGHGHFKIRNVVERLFYLALEVSRQRPIRQANACAQCVEVAVELEGELIQVVA
ncbi:hypothetical protein D3C72_2276210 [compost metagenome]